MDCYKNIANYISKSYQNSEKLKHLQKEGKELITCYCNVILSVQWELFHFSSQEPWKVGNASILPVRRLS